MPRKSIPNRLPRAPRLDILPGITKMDRMGIMTIPTRPPMLTTMYSLNRIPAILPPIGRLILPGRLD